MSVQKWYAVVCDECLTNIPTQMSVREPLIKNEKIRKAVRAWANVNEEKSCLCYDADENSLTDIFRNEISFNPMLDLEDCKEYTIEELCGEEKE